eukprot:5793952-Prymnesium_polylepis.1
MLLAWHLRRSTREEKQESTCGECRFAYATFFSATRTPRAGRGYAPGVKTSHVKRIEGIGARDWVAAAAPEIRARGGSTRNP